MTAIMPADYPDVFAGGAILSGVPYGCHSDLWAVEGPACMQIATLLLERGHGDSEFAATYPLAGGLHLAWPEKPIRENYQSARQYGTLDQCPLH